MHPGSAVIHYSHHRIAMGILVAVALLPWPAHSHPNREVSCGDTLGPGGTFVLDRDLECDLGSDDVAVTLLGGARLDLRHHAITCSAQPRPFLATGIRLEGEGTSVRNGRVLNCSIGVLVAGDGGHLVTRIDLRDCANNSFHILSDGNRLFDNSVVGGDFAFAVFGSDNLLIHNRSTAAEGNGFVVAGAMNRLHRNVSDGNVCHGFSVDGPDNRLYGNEANHNVLSNCPAINVFGGGTVLRSNSASDNSGDGFLLFFGDDNHLLRNSALNNAGAGIHIADTSTSNTLLRNTAVDNGGFDLRDDNVDCDANRWKRNEFEMASATCIE